MPGLTRAEIIEMFRDENKDITDKVASDIVLNRWLIQGNVDVCIKTKCIRKNGTIDSIADEDEYDLTDLEDFYEIDELSGGGVSYDDERLEEKSIGELDEERSSWRTEDSGTPKFYYRRMGKVHLVPAPDTASEDIDVYYIALPDDFNDDNLYPYNGHTFLKPFNYILVQYLKWRGKMKKGKTESSKDALMEYMSLIKDMKGAVSRYQYGSMYFEPPHKL